MLSLGGGRAVFMVPHKWKVTHPSCSGCSLTESWKSRVGRRLIRDKCSTLLGRHTPCPPSPRHPPQGPMSPLPQTALSILPEHPGWDFAGWCVGVGWGGVCVQTFQSVSGPLTAFLPGEGLTNGDSCLLAHAGTGVSGPTQLACRDRSPRCPQALSEARAEAHS